MQMLKISSLLFALSLIVLPLQAQKKLLPHVISQEGYSLTYTYDKENRIINTVQVAGQIVKTESTEYYPNNSGIKKVRTTYRTVEDFENSNAYRVQSDSIIYTESSPSKVVIAYDTQISTFTFTASGKVKQIKSQSNIYDEDEEDETSIAPPIIVAFKYDRNENIIGVDLPNNASGGRVNRDIQMLNYMKLSYDNKNGAFKHVSSASFMDIFDMGATIPCYHFIGNNLKKIAEKKMAHNKNEERITTKFSYKYNEDGYPIEVRFDDETYRITYTVAL